MKTSALFSCLLAAACVFCTFAPSTASAAAPDAPGAQPSLPRRLSDLPYGPSPRQRMDVYLPPHPSCAPILLMVHGGAWMVGNKSMPQVVDAKVVHWVRERGFVFVSIDYRMVPEADPAMQARDVARAMAAVQAAAPSWGADPARLVLMGHSAGAHLAALLSADTTLAAREGATPWLGTVVLDSAALDTVALMQRQHLRFYDRAFGSDPEGWRRASPTAQLAAGTRPPPMLFVCSTLRADGSCQQAQAFARKVEAAGGKAGLLPEDLTHLEVNAELGRPGAYTQAVDAFIDPLLAGPACKPAAGH